MYNEFKYVGTLYPFYLSQLGFATICQLITLFYPGRNQTMFYVCHGQLPISLLNEKIKANKSFNALLALTLFVQIIFYTRLFVYKWKQKAGSIRDQSRWHKFLERKFRKEALYRY